MSSPKKLELLFAILIIIVAAYFLVATYVDCMTLVSLLALTVLIIGSFG